MQPWPIGAAIRLYSQDTHDLGIVHAPAPVRPDDLVALEQGPPLRLTRVVALQPGGAVSYVAQVEEARS